MYDLRLTERVSQGEQLSRSRNCFGRIGVPAPRESAGLLGEQEARLLSPRDQP